MNLQSRVYATLSEVVANLGRMEQRRPRIRLHSLPDGAVFVVRGDELDPATIREDAANFHERFLDWGRYGLSAFLAVDDDEVDVLCATRLIRFATVAVFRGAALREVGIEIVPTFRTPHVTLCHPTLEELVTKLRACEHLERKNPYYED